MLGVPGVAREFAWGPNNLAQCCERIWSRMQGIAGWFTLPKAQAMAGARLAGMQHYLEALDQESLGYL